MARLAAHRIDELIELFGPYVEKADPQPSHWIAEGGVDLVGDNLCWPCAEKALQERLEAHPGAFIDGGYSVPASESSNYCDACGRLLEYALTAYGMEAEINHWLNDGDPNPLTPDQAFEIAAILDAAQTTNSARAQMEAVLIGERMLALIPDEKSPAEAGLEVGRRIDQPPSGRGTNPETV